MSVEGKTRVYKPWIADLYLPFLVLVMEIIRKRMLADVYRSRIWSVIVTQLLNVLAPATELCRILDGVAASNISYATFRIAMPHQTGRRSYTSGYCAPSKTLFSLERRLVLEQSIIFYEGLQI